MSCEKFAAVLLLALPALAAETPLPELRIEPTGGGSIFYIKNNSTVALKAYLIELVDYPGSSYSFWQDETVADPIPPMGEKRIQVANMTVGAVPDYVKMQAALYGGGASAGIAEKVAQLVERRRATLETVRQLIVRIDKAQAEKTSKADLVAALKHWAETPCSRRVRPTGFRRRPLIKPLRGESSPPLPPGLKRSRSLYCVLGNVRWLGLHRHSSIGNFEDRKDL